MKKWLYTEHAFFAIYQTIMHWHTIGGRKIRNNMCYSLIPACKEARYTIPRTKLLHLVVSELVPHDANHSENKSGEERVAYQASGLDAVDCRAFRGLGCLTCQNLNASVMFKQSTMHNADPPIRQGMVRYSSSTPACNETLDTKPRTTCIHLVDSL